MLSVRLPYPRAVASVLLIASAVTQSAAHEAVTPAPVTINSVVVKGQAMRDAATAYSTQRFDEEEVRERNVSQLQDLLRYIPGMEVRGFRLGGVADAFVLRGFNSGGHGGDAGIAIDGVPLNEAMSHADGYADLNVIVPLEVGDFSVLRGPVSAQYGNFNRGGLIVIESRKGGRYFNVDARVAGHQTLDTQLALGHPMGSGTLNLAAQTYRTDGYRPQSRFNRETASGRYAIDLTPRLQVATSARIHHGRWDSASYVTQTEFDDRERAFGKNSNVQNDGGDKAFSTFRVDANYKLRDTAKLLTFAYATRQDFTRYFSRPVSTTTWRQREETYQRDVLGTGLNLNGLIKAASVTVTYVAGVEAFRESTDFAFYDGLIARQRVAPAGNNRNFDFNSTSAFVEGSAAIHHLLQPTLGLRWDRFTGNCRRLGPETTTDPCERLARESNVSPKLGVRSQIGSALTLRTSITEGFALANQAAKYSAGANALKPNTLRQTELGAAFTAAPTLTLDVAAYRVTSLNEIRTLAPGVYENFGKTRRDGIEARADWHPLHDLHIDTTYATARSRVTENASAALVGKRVTGVPETTATVSAFWRPEHGIGGGVTLRRVGRSAIDAANSLFYPGYSTVDVQLSYSRGGDRPYRVYLGIDNAADRRYAAAAFVIGGLTLYAPAPPRSVAAGIQIDF